jgi:arylsulfatase A-like enzyme
MWRYVECRCVALSLLLLGIVPAAASEPAASRPNVLLIMADDVGRDVLGCYGGVSYSTPHIDALAESGTRFRHAYSMPKCHLSRITLLTGRYPFQLGNPRKGRFPVPAESQTVANVLKRAGYATAVAGKWQLAMLKDDPRHPHRLGFDDYCLFGWHEGPRYYQPHLWQNAKLRGDVKDRYGPDLYTEFLIDFMTRHRKRPFFAYYPMALCHSVTNDLEHPVPFGPYGRYDTYAEMTEAMDDRVGRLVAAIDRLGLREKTLIVFTTDNGTESSYIHTAKNGEFITKRVASFTDNEGLPGQKIKLTNNRTRAPLIVSWPGTVTEGQAVDDLVDFSDFLPTFAELTAAQLPADVSLTGQSFASRLVDNRAAPREWAFAEGEHQSWVRTERWKLYRDGRLFDLKTDPKEKHPLREDPQPTAATAREWLQKIEDKLFAGE